jgi:hypothetical protein
MQYSLVSVIAGVTLGALICTNPYRKIHYVQKVAIQAQTIWCANAESQTCETIARWPQPLLVSVIYSRTSSRNYYAFTTFHTSVPCLNIYGLGLGGRYWIRPVFDEDISLCHWLAAAPANGE